MITRRSQQQLSISTAAEEFDSLRLSRESNDHIVIAHFTVPGEPVSKSRARFTKRGSKTHAYTPEKTKDAERVVALLFRQATGPWVPSPDKTFGLSARFYSGTRQRRDVDNMVKLLLDGLNGIAWVDDAQVIEVSGRKSLLQGKPHTDVAVYVIGDVVERLTRCTTCGKMYATYPSWSNKTSCSDDCRLAARRRARLRTCAHCGVSWDPGKPSEARFCSRACMIAHGRIEMPCDFCGQTFSKSKCLVRATNYCGAECADAARKARVVKTRKGDCIDCGGPVSRREYKRCRGCFHSGRGTKGNPIVGPLVEEGSRTAEEAPYTTPAGREIGRPWEFDTGGDAA